MKHVCLEGGLMHAAGNVNAICEDGTKKVIRLRMTPTGRQIMGFGSVKRDLEKKPYTDAEVAMHTRFKVCKQAVEERKLDGTHAVEDRQEFRQSKYATFNGFLFAKAVQAYDADTQTVNW